MAERTESVRFTSPVSLGGGEWLSPTLGVIRITEVKFVTAAYLDSLPENETAVEVIRDRHMIRAYRRRLQRGDRALRRAQRAGRRVTRVPHRQAPHARHRILIRRPVE